MDRQGAARSTARGLEQARAEVRPVRPGLMRHEWTGACSSSLVTASSTFTLSNTAFSTAGHTDLAVSVGGGGGLEPWSAVVEHEDRLDKVVVCKQGGLRGLTTYCHCLSLCFRASQTACSGVNGIAAVA